jgi:hypothetical protein
MSGIIFGGTVTTQPNPNYLINSAFQVAQAATSATITAGTATPTASLGYPVVDSWFCYSVGGNPTLAQVAGSNTTANRLQLTGAASITSVGIGQRLEAINTTSLANKTVTLSFECSNSLLTSLTVVANRPTTTTNTFGTIGLPSKTLINSTNVAINSTLTRYSVTFTCPQDVDKGLEVLFVLDAQTSGTFVLANVKLEEGSVATTYVSSDFASELLKCQRHFERIQGGGLYTGTSGGGIAFPSINRVNSETPISFVPFKEKFAIPVIAFPTNGNARYVHSAGIYTSVTCSANSVTQKNFVLSGNTAPVSGYGWIDKVNDINISAHIP